MLCLALLAGLLPCVMALPLASNSLILSRMPAVAGAPAQPVYRAAVLEEWTSGSTGYTLAQTWNTTCTNLPADGKIQSSVPYLTDIYMLCRALPAGSGTAVLPATTVLGRLSEAGTWSMVTEFGSVFANGSSLHSLMVVEPENIMYMIGGGIGPQPNFLVAGNISNGRTLGTWPSSNNLFELVLYNNSINVLGTPPANGGSGTVAPPSITNTISLANGGPYITPTGWSITSALSIPETQAVVWFMVNVPKPSIVRFNISSPLSNETFGPPPKAGAGAVQFTLLTGRFEQTGFTIYLGNGSHIVSNTLTGLRTKAGYKIVAHAPPGWNYNSAVARFPLTPAVSPTPTATATATATVSTGATISPGASVSPSPTTSYSNSPTVTQSAVSPTSSVVASASETPTVSATPTVSQSPTPSVTETPTVTKSSDVTPSMSITPTPSITSTPSATPSPSVTPTPSITSTPSATPSPSVTPTSSVTSTASVTPTSSMTATPSNTGTPTTSSTSSVIALANAIPGGSAATPSGAPSNIGIAVGSCVGGMVFAAVVISMRSYYNRRKALTNKRTPLGRLHVNRMSPGPMMEISHNPAVQSWRQSHNPSLTASMSMRRIETTHTRKTFDPVIIQRD